MIHSAKARRNYEQQKARAKRTRDYQLGRDLNSDSFEFDSACDPRHAAFLRNKQAKLAAKSIPVPTVADAANNARPFIRANNVHV